MPVPAVHLKVGEHAAHILAVSGELFYRKGIRVVGVDEIIAEAGIAKATLYRHFKSKEDLVVAYLEDRSARLKSQFDDAYAEVVDGEHAILTLFDALKEKVRAPDFRGCAFFLAVSEHPESDRVRAVAADYKLFIRNHFARLLGQESVTRRPGLPHQLALIYEGALSLSVILPRDEFATHARDSAAILIRSIEAPVS